MTRKAFTFELDDFNGEVLLPNPENLQIAEDRLLRLRMAINLDTEEVALVLQVQFALQDDV